MNTVLLTDYAWPDTAIEAQVLGDAGLALVCGPSVPGTAAEVAALARQARPAAILTCWAPVRADAIAAAQPLRMVGRMGVGLDNIDVETCTQRGILVTNVPDYCVEEVSDHALGLVLAWTRGIATLADQTRRGSWNPAGARLRRLSALSVGIVGYGRIGRRTAAKLAPWGCRVLVHSRGAVADAAVQAVSLDELLARCDIVVIHAPLTDATQGLFDGARLAKMKRGALLVNVSRGGIVDSAALAEALASGHLGGAALDVVDTEPAVAAALREHPNALITPHVAFSSDASLAELRRRACEEVVRVLAGLPAHHPCNAVAA